MTCWSKGRLFLELSRQIKSNISEAQLIQPLEQVMSLYEEAGICIYSIKDNIKYTPHRQPA